MTDKAIEENLKRSSIFVAQCLQTLKEMERLRVLCYDNHGKRMIADAINVVTTVSSLELHVGRHSGFPEVIQRFSHLIEYQENRDPFTIIGIGGTEGYEYFAYQVSGLDEAEARERFVNRWAGEEMGEEPRIVAVLEGFHEPKGMITHKAEEEPSQTP